MKYINKRNVKMKEKEIEKDKKKEQEDKEKKTGKLPYVYYIYDAKKLK